MPQAAAIAAALTTAGAHRWSLFLAGTDVAKQPGAPGVGVDPGSIEIIEAGPGRVSSMAFTVDDPGKAVEVAEFAEVLFVDNDAPAASNRLFFGYAASSVYQPAFGGQGRTIEVQCLGAEVWLDWLRWYSPLNLSLTLTIGSSTAPAAIIEQEFQPIGGPLNLVIQSGTTGDGTLGAPISARLYGVQASLMTPGVLTAGTTWREAIGVLQDSATEAFPSTTPITVLVTVDFWLGLRMWRNDVSGVLRQPDDYTTLVVTEAAVPQGAALAVRVDWAEQMHRVWVTGSALSSSRIVYDGSGTIIGPVGAISRPDATTSALALQQGLAYLANREATRGGSFELLDWEPTTTVHAGGLVTITDTSTGLAAVTYRITEIRKTFNSVRQNWEVTFGAPPRRAMQRVTDLIRSTLR